MTSCHRSLGFEAGLEEPLAALRERWAIPTRGLAAAGAVSDVEKLRNHPLVGDRAVVGGFYYGVDTGLLERWD